MKMDNHPREEVERNHEETTVKSEQPKKSTVHPGDERLWARNDTTQTLNA